MSKKDMNKDGVPLESISSAFAAGNATSESRVEVNQRSASGHNAFYTATSSPGFYYEYNNTVPQSGGRGYFNPASGSYGYGSGFQSAGHMRGFHPSGNYSSFSNQNPGAFGQYYQGSYQSNGRGRNNDNRYKPRENFVKNGVSDAVPELTRGPRGQNRNNSSNTSEEIEQQALAFDRERYNLQEFQTEYDDAKFYVIKSYSEDNIHKSIKYGVWSSTPNGNKILDAAFREANDKRCPVFLFFSVNGSGQFVGVAEMTGPVDFSKNMDFWQHDKWNSFFPIQWHIIKDVPNSLLRHITLENNENKPVTFTRDTQEVGMRQGLEMLRIFKTHAETTSLLDDCSFYEDREKRLKSKKKVVPASQTKGDHEIHDTREGIIAEQLETDESDSSSLVVLTINLSLDS